MCNGLDNNADVFRLESLKVLHFHIWVLKGGGGLQPPPPPPSPSKSTTSSLGVLDQFTFIKLLLNFGYQQRNILAH